MVFFDNSFLIGKKNVMYLRTILMFLQKYIFLKGVCTDLPEGVPKSNYPWNNCGKKC